MSKTKALFTLTKATNSGTWIKTEAVFVISKIILKFCKLALDKKISYFNNISSMNTIRMRGV